MKYYAIIGQTGVTVDETTNPICPPEHIEMQGPPPTPEHVAQADGMWAIPVLTLAEAKAAKLAELTAARNNAIDNEGAEYKGLHFWADKGSKSDIHFAITAYDKVQQLPTAWKAQDGILMPVTPAGLLGIAIAVGNHVETQFAKFFVLAAKVEAAKTVGEVDAVQWTSVPEGV